MQQKDLFNGINIPLIVCFISHEHTQALEDEEKMTPEQLAIKNVGKQDPKRHLEEKVDTLMSNNIVQCLGAMLDTIVFK